MMPSREKPAIRRAVGDFMGLRLGEARPLLLVLTCRRGDGTSIVNLPSVEMEKCLPPEAEVGEFSAEELDMMLG